MTEIQNLDPQITAAFTSLRAAVKKCEDNDRAQAEAAEKRIKESAGTCEKSKVDEFKKKCQAVVEAMWTSYDTLEKGYIDKLRIHENVARNLHQVYVDTWTQVDKGIEPILTDIQERQKQTHWTGPGAEEYMKQLPTQVAAVAEFRQFVGVAGAGVETPALLQHAVFQATHNLISGRAQAVEGYAGSPNQGDDSYFQRCQWAKSALDGASDWFANTLMTGTNHWRPPLEEHNKEMTSSKVKSPEVLKGDKWPNATKDTKDSDIPKPPTGPKYTPPPSTTTLPTQGQPASERGNGQGIDDDPYFS